MKIVIYIFIINLFIILFFYLLNIFLKSYEHMSMKNIRLNKTLNNHGYDIDEDKFIIKKDNIVIKKYSSKNFNSYESHKIAKNKTLSNSIFYKNNIPVPIHAIIDSNNKDEYMYNRDIDFPCVLKPIDGMQGKDVNTFIKNIEQFRKILGELLNKYDKVMFENQVYGDNYRIFVFNDQVMDIIKREQPFVIGDGKETVKDLIKDKNNLQKKNNLFPTNNLDWNYIKEQGYEEYSILPENKKIFITNTINFHNGANPVRVKLDNIPDVNKEMFIKAHKLIGLECSGIDYMSYDITKPYYENDGHIIEINDMVDTKIHVDADNGKNPNFLFDNIYNSLIEKI